MRHAQFSAFFEDARKKMKKIGRKAAKKKKKKKKEVGQKHLKKKKKKNSCVSHYSFSESIALSFFGKSLWDSLHYNEALEFEHTAY